MIDILGTIVFFIFALMLIKFPIAAAFSLIGGALKGEPVLLFAGIVMSGISIGSYYICTALYDNCVLDVIEMFKG